MARIRSIHPGLFTDETFVTLSPAAQILWIGLWCEADDQGVFEWRPVTLKMRLLPASTTTIVPLLEELQCANCIHQYECEGREYGVVRNFVRYQRPKSPKCIHPLPVEFRTYAGFIPDGGRPSAVTGRPSFGTGRALKGGGFGTSSELDDAEHQSSSELDCDERQVVPREGTTSSEAVRVLQRRGRREEEGGRKEPSREPTLEDGTGVTPSPACARTHAHQGAPARTPTPAHAHTREGRPPADAGPPPAPEPAAWPDSAPLGRDAAAGGAR